jgi:hypothetical protein
LTLEQSPSASASREAESTALSSPNKEIYFAMQTFFGSVKKRSLARIGREVAKMRGGKEVNV